MVVGYKRGEGGGLCCRGLTRNVLGLLQRPRMTVHLLDDVLDAHVFAVNVHFLAVACVSKLASEFRLSWLGWRVYGALGGQVKLKSKNTVCWTMGSRTETNIRNLI